MWFFRLEQRKRRIATSSMMSWAGLYLLLEWLLGWVWPNLTCHHRHLPLRLSDRCTSSSCSDFSWDWTWSSRLFRPVAEKRGFKILSQYPCNVCSTDKGWVRKIGVGIAQPFYCYLMIFPLCMLCMHLMTEGGVYSCNSQSTAQKSLHYLLAYFDFIICFFLHFQKLGRSRGWITRLKKYPSRKACLQLVNRFSNLPNVLVPSLCPKYTVLKFPKWPPASITWILF